MTTNLLSKVIQFAPGPAEQLPSKMSAKNNEIMVYTSHPNQILLPELGDRFALSAYFELLKIPYKICQICNGEDMSPDGIMPFIAMQRDNKTQIVCGYKDIIETVQKKDDSQLAGDNLQDMVKLSAFHMLLHNSEENYLWNNDDVYKNITYPYYSYAKPWPIGSILSWSKRNQIVSKLNKIEEDDSKSFEKTCEKLNLELANNGIGYMNGTHLTELDTLIYGHLKAIKVSASEGSFLELWEIVEPFPNLINYMEFIQDHLDKLKQKE